MRVYKNAVNHDSIISISSLVETDPYARPVNYSSITSSSHLEFTFNETSSYVVYICPQVPRNLRHRPCDEGCISGGRYPGLLLLCGTHRLDIVLVICSINFCSVFQFAVSFIKVQMYNYCALLCRRLGLNWSVRVSSILI